MIVAIDTNILRQAFVDEEVDHRTVVQFVVQKHDLCHDHDKVILQEYQRNVGKSLGFRKWYQRLQQRQAIHYCSGKLPESCSSKLSRLGCHEPSDQVFVGVAYNSDKILISEDSDVGKGPKGSESPHRDAHRYLTQAMGLRVYDAAEAIPCLEI